MEVDSSMGKIYTDHNGMTLYTFDKDEAGKSNCYDQCAVNWPPFAGRRGRHGGGRVDDRRAHRRHQAVGL